MSFAVEVILVAPPSWRQFGGAAILAASSFREHIEKRFSGAGWKPAVPGGQPIAADITPYVNGIGLCLSILPVLTTP